MTVRAKFRCTQITESEGGLKSAALTVVGASTPDSENSQFFKWTPSGNINLGTMNEQASSQFRVGAEYYVDFTEAPADPVAGAPINPTAP